MENLSLQEQSDSLLSLSEFYSYDDPDTAVYYAELAISIQKENFNDVTALSISSWRMHSIIKTILSRQYNTISNRPM
jgi:hypothetical protein